MPTHDFAFILDALPDDEGVEDTLVDEPFLDATLVFQNGALALSFDREAETFREAVRSAREDIERTGIPILGFDPDYLATKAGAAGRTTPPGAAIGA